MRRVVHKLWLAALLGLTTASFAAAQCPTNYAQIIATKLGGATPLASGRMTVTAHDAANAPLNYGVLGQGTELMTPKIDSVVNGALVNPLCLPLAGATTTPVVYHFVVRDTRAGSSGAVVLDVDNVAITAAPFSLDTYSYPDNSGFNYFATSLIQIGTVTPLAPGAIPYVTNSGTLGSAILNFGLAGGLTGTISVGQVSAGNTAAVFDSGTPQAGILNFVLPRGPAGVNASVGSLTGNFVDAAVSGTVDGNNKVFTLSGAGTGYSFVYLNGVLLSSGRDYTLSGQTLTLVVAPDPNGLGPGVPDVVRAVSTAAQQ